MQPASLPSDLPPRFSVRQARALGVSTSRLRRADLERPFHGVRATADAVADDARDRTGAPRGERERAHFERARRYTSRMGDDEFFSHLTAAVLWDIPVPTRALKTAPLHVAIARPGRLSRAAGVRGHQVVAAATGVVIEPRTGLRVTDPATTWATLGSILKDPYDVVAAGDAVVRTWRIAEPLATIEDLAEVLTRGRRVGIGSLRAALPRICTRSASRPETHVRLALIDAGMPEPQLNVEVWRADTYLGAVDLAYPEWKIAIEYEGGHHLLSTEQWTRDIARYDRLRDEGWIVIRVTRVDLFNNPGALMQRIRSAVRSRAGSPAARSPVTKRSPRRHLATGEQRVRPARPARLSQTTRSGGDLRQASGRRIVSRRRRTRAYRHPPLVSL